MLVLGSVTREEIANNAKKSYAALIKSGEIVRVECRHSKSGNVLLAVEGKSLHCTDFNNNNFEASGCILYNPAQVGCIVEACDDSNTPIFIVNGAVSKTAPASTDTVVSLSELKKEEKAAKKPLKNA